MEEGLLRKRSKQIPQGATLGYCNRTGQRCAEDIGLQDLPSHASRTRKTRRIHQRKFGEGIYPSIKITILFAVLLRWEEGWEIKTSGRLQEAQRVHSTRSIPPTPYPGTGG